MKTTRSIAIYASALALFVSSQMLSAQLLGNRTVKTFERAKDLAEKIHEGHAETIYCPCKYVGDKILPETCDYRPRTQHPGALKLQWEHVVPAENFGRSFKEWREGDPKCVGRNKKGKKIRFTGRKCAKKVSEEFRLMESDLYNIYPAVGDMNMQRSNIQMGEISDSEPFGTFGGDKCTARILFGDHERFMPMNQYKGLVARTYMYMDASYPGRGILSDQRLKLFIAWDKMFPPTDWECQRAEEIRKIQGNENSIVTAACRRPRDPQSEPSKRKSEK